MIQHLSTTSPLPSGILQLKPDSFLQYISQNFCLLLLACVVLCLELLQPGSICSNPNHSSRFCSTSISFMNTLLVLQLQQQSSPPLKCWHILSLPLQQHIPLLPSITDNSVHESAHLLGFLKTQIEVHSSLSILKENKHLVHYTS